MPIQNYGVLRGNAVAGKLAGRGGKKPHYQIHLVAQEVHYRIAVNVVSDQSPSELLFLLDPDFDHPVLPALVAVEEGFTSVASRPGGPALDFNRGTFFRPQDMTALPCQAPGPENDLAEVFEFYVNQAIKHEADLFAFGSRWGPEPGNDDDYFGFAPGNGIHDIHLNQGSPPPHKGDNGVWQDGALFIHLAAEDKWLAFFLAFQSQFAKTDNRGNPVPGSPPFGPVPAAVRIIAALVNPAGSDTGRETVTLLNTGPNTISLSGWTIITGAGDAGKHAVDAGALNPGDCVRVALTPVGAPLPNIGGTVTLLDASGHKVDGVAYTQAQASAEGWSITF